MAVAGASQSDIDRNVSRDARGLCRREAVSLSTLDAAHNEKAPDDAGALTSQIEIRSVLCDDRASPVEAVDQLAAHAVLAELLVLRNTGRQAAQ